MNYTDKLRQVKEFIEDNFDDPVELVIALGLSVEDIINLLPDLKNTRLKMSRTTLDQERLGKSRKREVINNEMERDWETELKDYELGQLSVDNTERGISDSVHGTGFKP